MRRRWQNEVRRKCEDVKNRGVNVSEEDVRNRGVNVSEEDVKNRGVNVRRINA